MCETKKSSVSQEILAYLENHQDAQDTLEGIAEWWVVGQRVAERTVAVKEALDDLVARGFLIESRGRDARAHYRVNKRPPRR